MDIRKKMLIGIVIISFFILLVAILVFVYALSSEGQSIPSIFEPFLDYHIHFMVLMGFFGVFSGVIAYSILNATIEKKKKLVNTNINIVMKFLNKEDQEILHLLLQKDGMTTQSEISRLPGMTRLKAHRVVKKLEDHKIIHIEKHGKINLIRLVDELKNLE
ncbi:hypothetical protein HYT84_03035 [Candidatus Micrarchaeota archaeon]|nr:hypothetical protein [Candidatus Micrarchaeota archaeon]